MMPARHSAAALGPTAFFRFLSGKTERKGTRHWLGKKMGLGSPTFPRNGDQANGRLRVAVVRNPPLDGGPDRQGVQGGIPRGLPLGVLWLLSHEGK